MSKNKNFPVTNEEAELTMLVEAVIAQFRMLEGKMLTVVDAALVDERQNKAFKDIVKRLFGEQMDHIVEMAKYSQQMNLQGKMDLQSSDYFPGFKADVETNRVATQTIDNPYLE